jgi:hypothetical protein
VIADRVERQDLAEPRRGLHGLIVRRASDSEPTLLASSRGEKGEG